MEKTKLYFHPSYKEIGFKTASTSSTNNKKPFSVVRELLQNSYDAALESCQRCAEVKFSFEPVRLRDVPGVEEYRDAVNYIAEEGLEEELEKDILSIIQNELKGEQTQVLFVADNGIGFDNNRMISVLGDGISRKENPDSSSGSYGIGHFSAFSISSLRYILYGGVLKTNERVASGMALLRTHKDSSEKLRSNEGIYATTEEAIASGSKNLPSGSQIPKIIKNKLNEIQRKKGSGSVVVIPGFNNFGDDDFDEKRVADLILGTAARNFFVAVSEGQLRVEVEAGGYTDCLERKSLDRILKETSEIKDISPKYQTVERFYDTLNKGHREKIKTPEGKVEIRYLEACDGRTQFALCRNGMWITNKISFGLTRQAFTDYRPHNILVLVLPEKNRKDRGLFDLVKQAENSSHDSIELNIVNNQDKKKRLKKSFAEIKKRLREILPKDNNEEINIPIPGLEIEMAGDVVDAPSRSVRKSTKTRNIKVLPPSDGSGPDSGPGPGGAPPLPPPPPRNPSGERHLGLKSFLSRTVKAMPQ